jgi:hypothetical protein
MVTYIQIEAYKRSTGGADYKTTRVELAGTETLDEVKAKIREKLKITSFEKDELNVNGEVLTDTVDFESFLNPKYTVYLKQREESVDFTVKGRPVLDALKGKNYEKAIQFRAGRIQATPKFYNKNKPVKNNA